MAKTTFRYEKANARMPRETISSLASRWRSRIIGEPSLDLDYRGLGLAGLFLGRSYVTEKIIERAVVKKLEETTQNNGHVERDCLHQISGKRRANRYRHVP